MTTPSNRLDQTVERLSKLRSLPAHVRARLEEAALVTAEKMSTADRAKMEREAKKRKKKQPDASTTGGSIGSMADGYAANQSGDLAASC